ncbi:MAG: di-trans,poly-cis-decaprenylcistransferase [Arenimonas sp.]|nr:di-trans,poly-cis-decaprenylcistransferase [Arenimonas sp.]
MPAALPAERKPRHLAVIMDGNGRWAERRQRPRTLGHRAGVKAVQVCVEFCLAQGIEALTLFAFSSENWNRPQDEVGALMKLFLRMLDSEVDELHRRGVRVAFIGERSQFPEAIRERMARSEQLPQAQTRLTLTIAAGYGGRWDITQACRQLVADAVAGRIQPDAIDEAMLHSRLGLAGLPEPDLFIRTGGDLRISNFLLWQLAYTELWFTDTLWPDLDDAVLLAALADFGARERRFGLTSEQVSGGPA